jgi:UDP-N-acetylmuramoylalanine--D-glutamate ligase
MMNLENISLGKPFAVFGLARSGLSVIRTLTSQGIKVYANDDAEGGRSAARHLGAKVETLTPEILKSCAALILAPGVPLHFPAPHPVVAAARAAGIETICDVELLLRMPHGRKVIGITGTNGKSTTTALVHHVLKACGVDAVMGGNIGVPVFDMAMQRENGVFVLELSSYQLDLMPRGHIDVALLLNITPDHLDRHGSMENYAAAKARIFAGPGVAIIGVDDLYSKNIAAAVQKSAERKIQTLHIGGEPSDANAFVTEGVLYVDGVRIADFNEILNIKGAHNHQNAAACFLIGRALGLKDEAVLRAMQNFKGLAHRQYPVRRIGHVTYINDSKATNAEAAEKALSAFENIFWIAGGRAKDGGLNGLQSLMPRIKRAFLIGEAADDFAQWLDACGVSYEVSGTLEQAVKAAHQAAQQSGREAVVLLSPACASFDQFTSYEQRGDQFAALVKALQEGCI